MKCVASQRFSPPYVLFFLWNFYGRWTRISMIFVLLNIIFFLRHCCEMRLSSATKLVMRCSNDILLITKVRFSLLIFPPCLTGRRHTTFRVRNNGYCWRHWCERQSAKIPEVNISRRDIGKQDCGNTQFWNTLNNCPMWCTALKTGTYWFG